VSIGRRVMLLLVSALIVVAMAAVTASPAFANTKSDNQLRHRIDRIQDRPGPLTHHEQHLIHQLRQDIRQN
jgi:cytochrome c-type biogenesis protein CcmH/NrfG